MSKFSPLSLRSPLDELARVLNSFGHRHRIDQVFFDWIEMCALSLSNSVDRRQYADREARYMAIVGRYSKEEAMLMAEMFSLLILTLERGFDSPFHTLISKLELGSAGTRKRMGQYFTPFNVSYMMAQMILGSADKLAEQVAEKGYITVMEPACGAGGMILAVAKVLEEAGINFQKHLHVTAVDIDGACVCMTYVQASLIGIPAVILQGNSLGPPKDMQAQWFTPFHVLFGWNRRLYEHPAPDLQEQPSESAASAPPLDGPQVAESYEADQATSVPTEAITLPDEPIGPLGIAKWRINWDPTGPTVSLP